MIKIYLILSDNPVQAAIVLPTGFSDLNHNVVSEGAVNGLFLNRNAPDIAYVMFAPTLHFDNIDSTYVGGFFLDGRVNTLEEQAQNHF